MLYRDTISSILHDVQANRKGALTLEEPSILNPRLRALKPSISRSSSTTLKLPKTLYNKSRKRGIIETTDNTDNGIKPSAKKINLRVVITSLSKEIERLRKVKEIYKSHQQRALKLLEKEYKGRLKIGAFLKAVRLFKDKGNTVSFLSLEDTEYRDLWLETKVDSHL